MTCTDYPSTFPLVVGWICRWWVWSLFMATGDDACDSPESEDA